MTWRVGNHQPRNLYRGDQYIGVCFDPADTALIVDVMEGRTDTPDVDHTNGGREALAHIAERVADHAQRGGLLTLTAFADILEAAAAELGLGEEAPGSPRISPSAAQNRPGVLVVANGGSEAPDGSQGECDCGHGDLPLMFHFDCPLRRAWIADQRATERPGEGR